MSRRIPRRKFLKQCLMGGCGGALGLYSVSEFLSGEMEAGLHTGFPNDAPQSLPRCSKEAAWYEPAGSGQYAEMHCRLCPHQCVLRENDRGRCRTRVAKNGKLYTLAYGNPCAVNIDPVEKKPLHHFLPGTSTLSFAAAGCNLRCLNCQNWDISQARPDDTDNFYLPPEQAAAALRERRLPSAAYTYTEPLMSYEFVLDCAERIRESGLKNILVTAGYVQKEPLRLLSRFLDGVHVDLKSFEESFYRRVCGASLKPVLGSLETLRQEGVWVEVVRLLVTGLSDDPRDVGRMSAWIAANLGPDTPLHLSRFHPSYKLNLLAPTPLEALARAKQAAQEQGLRYVYIGNVAQDPVQDTICPQCSRHVISRIGYRIAENMLQNGICPCGARIPGVWS